MIQPTEAHPELGIAWWQIRDGAEPVAVSVNLDQDYPIAIQCQTVTPLTGHEADQLAGALAAAQAWVREHSLPSNPIEDVPGQLELGDTP
ncbi:MAG: hypothetical protein ACRDQA_19175 [Nocardioidaceae bacterium]